MSILYQGEDITSAWDKTQFLEMYENKTRLKRIMVQTAIAGYCHILCRIDRKGIPINRKYRIYSGLLG